MKTSGHGSRVTLTVLLAAAAGSARAPPPLSAQCAADSAALVREKASGYDVDGEPSIFVGVASFRDPLCRSTVLDALGSAQFPSRVFFGIVQQNNAEVGDPPCLLPAERRREAGHRVSLLPLVASCRLCAVVLKIQDAPSATGAGPRCGRSGEPGCSLRSQSPGPSASRCSRPDRPLTRES